MSAIGMLFQANIGRVIETTVPDEGVVQYAVHKLSDKKSKITSGEKLENLIIARVGDEAKVISMHPNVVLELFDKGETSDYKLLPMAAAETTAEDQAALQNELTTEQNAGDATTAAAPTKAEAKAAAKEAKEAAKVAAAAAKVPDPVKEAAKAEKAKKAADRKAKIEANAKAREDEKLESAKRAEEKQGNSKKFAAVHIFRTEPATIEGNELSHRQRVIAKFKAKTDAGGLAMGSSGANTYYQNCRDQWKDVVLPEGYGKK